jgi:hypothetical protein
VRDSFRRETSVYAGVYHVYAIVSNPRDRDDAGRVTTGFYKLKDGVLTMCDGDGVPVRHGSNGELITHRLARGEDAKAVAKRLTLRIFTMANGDAMGGFHRPIHYPKLGWM